MNLTLRHLRAFVAVAQLGGFSAAAARLHLTQSALSMLVRALEEDLGVTLFERTTRKVMLTDAGRGFLPQAEAILVDLHNAVAETRAWAARARGRIVVATTPTFAATLLPRALERFQVEHPDVLVVVRDDLGPAGIQRLVQEGAAELGIAPVDRSRAELLVIEVLMDDELVLAVPVAHSLARLRQASWKALAGAPLIAFGRDNALQALVDGASAAAGVQLAPRYEVSSISTAVSMVEAGLGVAVLPSYARTLRRSRRIQYRPLVAPAVQRELCLLAHRDRAMPPAAQAFGRILRAQMAADVV
ncbi:LysR family transcriptional regulator [Orrella sp. JC864]|uniref:LysR family transcriptional regulator n=1 Tax=Orrella sp. JC864 TaxID=3120298 RepID=UPI00300B112D